MGEYDKAQICQNGHVVNSQATRHTTTIGITVLNVARSSLIVVRIGIARTQFKAPTEPPSMQSLTIPPESTSAPRSASTAVSLISGQSEVFQRQKI